MTLSVPKAFMERSIEPQDQSALLPYECGGDVTLDFMVTLQPPQLACLFKILATALKVP